MWMDAYVEEILLRERIADAQRRAALSDRLVRGTKPHRARATMREVVARWFRGRTHRTPREAAA